MKYHLEYQVFSLWQKGQWTRNLLWQLKYTDLNGSQLAKMKKSIPDMSLP